MDQAAFSDFFLSRGVRAANRITKSSFYGSHQQMDPNAAVLLRVLFLKIYSSALFTKTAICTLCDSGLIIL